MSVEVSAVLLLSFGRACLNLNTVLGADAGALLDGLAPSDWVPIDRYNTLIRSTMNAYAEPAPILERVGAETMRIWYEFGPGKSVVLCGLDFLKFQTGSEGYHSVVRGPRDLVGAFSLESVDEAAGRAVVRSTTPFSRDVERGVLSGGMALTGDLSFIEVQNAGDRDVFEIEFH